MSGDCIGEAESGIKIIMKWKIMWAQVRWVNIKQIQPEVWGSIDCTSICGQGYQRNAVLSAPNTKMSCSCVGSVQVTPWVVQEQVVTPICLQYHGKRGTLIAITWRAWIKVMGKIRVGKFSPTVKSQYSKNSWWFSTLFLASGSMSKIIHIISHVRALTSPLNYVDN